MHGAISRSSYVTQEDKILLGRNYNSYSKKVQKGDRPGFGMDAFKICFSLKFCFEK